MVRQFRMVHDELLHFLFGVVETVVDLFFFTLRFIYTDRNGLNAGDYRCIGSYGNRKVVVDYPIAFCNAVLPILRNRTSRKPFRFILLSGCWAVQDQNAPLWVLPIARKTNVSLPCLFPYFLVPEHYPSSGRGIHFYFFWS